MRGHMERRLFALWMGYNEMSPRRQECLESLKATGCVLEYITLENMTDWLVDGAPLHASFEHLSAVHRADYFRTYLMHFHGGGYSDIKYTTASWLPHFDLLDESDALGNGYREVGPLGVARIHGGGLRYRLLRTQYRHLLGNGAYIFRPRSIMTELWWRHLNDRLDSLLPSLEQFPARFPAERGGQVYDGLISQYPVRWSYILGDIFHPLCFRFRRKLLRTLPAPSFQDYQ